MLPASTSPQAAPTIHCLVAFVGESASQLQNALEFMIILEPEQEKCVFPDPVR